MKHTNLKWLIVVMLLVVFSISACGKKTDQDKKSTKSNTKTNTEEPATKEDDSKKLPDEEQMAKDIDSCGANIIDLPSGYYELSTSTVKIDKAKTDEEQYIVYCTATQESDMFKANNQYVMTYNYYDVGGWILDDCMVEEIDMVPQCCMEEDEVYFYAMCGKNFSTLECTKVERVSEEQYICYYKGVSSHAYMDEVYTVEVNCFYDNIHGWQAIGRVVSSYRDWSKTYGVWYGEWAFGGVKMAYTTTVKQINENDGTITCDIKITKESYDSTQGKIVSTTKDFKNVSGKIEIDDFVFHTESGIEYLAEMPISFDWNDSIYVYWGKDVGLTKVYFDDGSQPRCTKIK